MIEPMPKDAASAPPMLLDLQGLLMGQPFANDVCPAKGKGQQRHQLLQPLRMRDVGLFQAKAATLQTRKERLDLPAPGVVRKRRQSPSWRNHNHVFARREPHPTNEQWQSPDDSRLL